MGSCGNGDGKTSSIDKNQVAQVDFDDTLPFDSQLSPSSFSGGKYAVGGDNEWQYLESTVPFDDYAYLENTVPFDDDAYLEKTAPLGDDAAVDDALETQPVNLAGETQVLSFAGETQVLDEIDDEEDINTQLLDVVDEVVAIDSHGDRTNRTEVLENVNELSSDYPQCIVGAQSADPKVISCEPLCRLGENKLLEKTDAVINQQISSGSMPPRFTSIRVESLREAGLSARNMDLKHTKNGTKSVMGMSQSQEPLSVKDNEELFLGCPEKTREVDMDYDDGEYRGEVEGGLYQNKSRIGSSAVRKLFNDDLPAEKEGCSLNSNDVNGGEKLSIYDDELAGLSYVNSQEPGELSQANALDVVDRLLKDNVLEFDQETNFVKNVKENSKTLPRLKGQQSLAKRANGSGNSGKTGVYDWDDSREDEGGGDIFLRRKDEFLEGERKRRKSLPAVKKINVGRPGDDYNNGEEKLGIHKKKMREVHSDSRLLLHNLRVGDDTVKEAANKSRRNLVNDLDEQFNINSSKVQLEPNATAADAQGMLDVGLDTQMAAEAMEALGNCEDIGNHVANEATRSSLADQSNNSSTRVVPITSKKCSGQYDKNWKVDAKSDLQNSSLLKTHTEEAREHCKKDNLIKRSKRSTLNMEDNLISSASKLPSQVIEQRKSTGASKRRKANELNNYTGSGRENGGSLVNKRHLQSQVCHSTPVAYKTRRSLVAKQLVKPDKPSRSLRKEDGRVGSLEKRNSNVGIQASKALDPKSTLSCSDHCGVDENTNLSELEKLASKLSAVNNGTNRDTLDHPRRSLRKLSSRDKGSEGLVGSSNPSVQSEDVGLSASRMRKMRTDAGSAVRSRVNCHMQLPSHSVSVRSSIDPRQKQISDLNLEQANSGDTPTVVDKCAKLNSKGKDDAAVLLPARRFVVPGLDESPRERFKSSDLASATPDNIKTPVNDASPVCMGDNYYKQSCNRELLRELRSLSATRLEFITPSKDSRKRRDITDVRILYSQHLDEDIIKHQKKILARLGVSVATSIIDATHFIADQFVRTRNMLEAIASGKPVVTHTWIESCGQTSCLIDEKNYILRDAKKEKEFGFSMPVSLARATRHPILEGRRVLITPNTKPSKEIVSSLVKAVQGQAVERIGRSSLKDDKIQDGLLILSCEEDYASCVPFLEKGAAVYSSELLLNGIITQKLEYERHRLFVDHVKKTRSTIWLKGDGGTYRPVTRCK